ALRPLSFLRAPTSVVGSGATALLPAAPNIRGHYRTAGRSIAARWGDGEVVGSGRPNVRFAPLVARTRSWIICLFSHARRLDAACWRDHSMLSRRNIRYGPRRGGDWRQLEGDHPSNVRKRHAPGDRYLILRSSSCKRHRLFVLERLWHHKRPAQLDIPRV